MQSVLAHPPPWSSTPATMRRMLSFVPRSGCIPALLLILTAAPLASAAPASLSADQRARIAALASAYLERAATPGLTVYIDGGGEPLYTSGFGMADIEHRVAATPDSVYAIGSITKAFTAHAVLQLVVEGRLSLDGTVEHYLPDYVGPARAVTIRQLLTHTSGIPNYVNDIPTLQPKLQRTALRREEIVAAFAPLPLQFAPGSEWSYSNSGYYLLGLILERVTGRTYYDYLQDAVLKPLGIARVFTGDDRELVVDRARGYEGGPQGIENAAPWFYLVPFSAGSLLTTARELARYRRAVFTSPAVGADLRKLMTSAVSLTDGTVLPYTCGALIRSAVSGLTKYLPLRRDLGLLLAARLLPRPRRDHRGPDEPQGHDAHGRLPRAADCPRRPGAARIARARRATDAGGAAALRGLVPSEPDPPRPAHPRLFGAQRPSVGQPGTIRRRGVRPAVARAGRRPVRSRPRRGMGIRVQRPDP